jgi:hypothetical protein
MLRRISKSVNDFLISVIQAAALAAVAVMVLTLACVVILACVHLGSILWPYVITIISRLSAR